MALDDHLHAINFGIEQVNLAFMPNGFLKWLFSLDVCGQILGYPVTASWCHSKKVTRRRAPA